MSRRFAIADIHGCAATFAALLAIIDFRHDDTLYLLGDYIDRGPDSRGVLDIILALIASGYNIHALRGNHEQMVLDALDDPVAFAQWKGNGGYGTLQQFGVTHPAELPTRYLDFFASLPLLLKLGDYLLVHAGLDFRMTDPIVETSPDNLLWARDYNVEPDKLAGLTLVTGHSVTPLFAIRASLNSYHIKLDNGCYDRGEMGCGALVVFNLDTRKLDVVKNCE